MLHTSSNDHGRKSPGFVHIIFSLFHYCYVSSYLYEMVEPHHRLNGVTNVLFIYELATICLQVNVEWRTIVVFSTQHCAVTHGWGGRSGLDGCFTHICPCRCKLYIMITSSSGKISPFVRGIHQSPVGSLHKASNAELWSFLWFASEQTVAQTIDTPVIWETITLWCHCYVK